MKIGCCGWRIKKEKKYGSVLATYASKFNVVEVNSTFYKLPRVETAIKWRNEVPKNFEFTVKANKMITHIDKFKTKKSIEYFEKMVKIAKVLKSKIILIQTPKSFKDFDAIEKFFKKASYEKIAIELRGFSREEIKQLTNEFGLIHVVDPFKDWPVTKRLYYFRLHGNGEKMYYWKYKESELRWLAKKLPKRSYVFFNNIYMCKDALRFKKIIEKKK